MSKRRTNGEGTIYFNKDRQRYECQFSYTDPNTGLPRRKKFVGGTQKELRNRKKTFIKEISLERERFLQSTSTPTIKEWLDTWLNDFMKPTVKIKTFERYQCTINNHLSPHIGNTLLPHLTTEDIQDMLLYLRDEIKLAPRTINTARRTLKAALNYAVQLEKIAKNPADATKAFKTERPVITVLSHQQANTLINITYQTGDYSSWIAIVIALFTGMRLSEITGLTWKNVDLDKGLIYVTQGVVSTNHGPRLETTPKTQSSNRQIPLPQFCINALIEYRSWQDNEKLQWQNQYHDNNFVVCNEQGDIRDPSYFSYHIFKKLLSEAGLPKSIRFHDLRHTHATWLLEAGENPKVISERLGHSSIRITLDTYSHLLKGMQQPALEKLDALSEKW